MDLLGGLKLVTFFLGIFIASGVLIPKGILFYFQWRSNNNKSLLSNSIVCLVNGFVIIIFLLAMAIADILRVMK